VRQLLKNIVELTDNSLYRSKLKMFIQVKTVWSGNYIKRRDPYSLTDAYARFVDYLVVTNKRHNQMYMHRYRQYR
jgi:hypothetical protein